MADQRKEAAKRLLRDAIRAGLPSHTLEVRAWNTFVIWVHRGVVDMSAQEFFDFTDTNTEPRPLSNEERVALQKRFELEVDLLRQYDEWITEQHSIPRK